MFMVFIEIQRLIIHNAINGILILRSLDSDNAPPVLVEFHFRIG